MIVMSDFNYSKRKLWGKCINLSVFILLWSPGPSQNPVALQQLPGVSYGITNQPPYNPVQAKAPVPPGPGLYPAGLYQPIPPVSSYQPGPPPTSYPSSAGQPLLPRPPMGGHPSHTPPQSASPSPGPRMPMPPAQATPPPPAVSSSSYYPNPQQPMTPAWQYNTPTPPLGPATSISAPPMGPVANHVNPAATIAGPSLPSSASYSSAAPLPPPPNMSYSTTQPPGPGMPPTSLHGYTQPGKYIKAYNKEILSVSPHIDFTWLGNLDKLTET